jgi:hypothetical protein
MFCAGLASDGEGHGEVVRARRFEVLDAAGNVWAVLGDGPKGFAHVPGLWLYDPTGNLRASLRVGSLDMTILSLQDAVGKGEICLMVSRRGTASLGVKTKVETSEPDGTGGS